MADLQQLHELLVTKGKVRGNPVGVSLFREEVPAGYEPIDDTPCAIIKYARMDGRRVYFDAAHHDCLVGVHHAGMVPGTREIVSGEYLSASSSFFTYDGAARLKAGTPVLPPGRAVAIGAAPLADVPEGVAVDWIVVVANPHHANFIASSRLAVEGIPAYGSLGVSLCGDLFAQPYHLQNIIMSFGDVGGRMHNKIKQDEVFVIVPIQFAAYLPVNLENVKIDVKLSRRMTKPAHSPFWQKEPGGAPPVQAPPQAAPRSGGTAPPVTAAAPPPQVAPAPAGAFQYDDIILPEGLAFTMPWADDARQLLAKTPEGILEMVVPNAEEYARGKGYPNVTYQSIDEQMRELGMDLQEMLDSM